MVIKSETSSKDYTIKDVIDYRTIAWPDSKDFLYLTEIPLKFESHFVTPDYYCFGMISQGGLEISINNQLYSLSSNSLMIYRPGQPWKVYKVAEKTSGSFVLFTRRFLESLNENIFSVKTYSFLSPGIASLIELSTDDKEKLICLFHEIFAILSHLSKPIWELVARNLTSALIYEINDVLENYIDKNAIKLNRDEEIFVRFNQLTSIHFKTERKPEFYAAQLFISPNYLYTTVKKISGKTPSDLINRQVINEAKYLVGYTSVHFGELAETLNFCDQFTFSKYFKRYTGFSPLQYRKNTAVPGLESETDI